MSLALNGFLKGILSWLGRSVGIITRETLSKIRKLVAFNKPYRLSHKQFFRKLWSTIRSTMFRCKKYCSVMWQKFEFFDLLNENERYMYGDNNIICILRTVTLKCMWQEGTKNRISNCKKCLLTPEYFKYHWVLSNNTQQCLDMFYVWNLWLIFNQEFNRNAT